MDEFLKSTEIIDWKTPAVYDHSRHLTSGVTDKVQIAKVCYEWVRDNIHHSGDYQASVTTCTASEVLQQGTGWCFAKSHLLAALLRANGLPASLCYQRLILDGYVYTLHGLNAVYLPEFGWYRLDPRRH
jgi:transglutaminase-like putative cysteine protease